jgi:anti-sigma factor RsiW
MNGHANDYVKEWLGAYLDGELAKDRRGWVEDHLASCLECRQELAELRALTMLLHADPAPSVQMDGEPFAARVVKRLPPLPRAFNRRALRVTLRYAPLGVFGLWAFFQAVLWVSAILLFALNLFPQAEGILAIFPPSAGSGAAGWLGGIFSLAGPGQPALDLVAIDRLGSLVLINLALIILLGLLFLAWLAGLYSYRRGQTKQRPSGP